MTTTDVPVRLTIQEWNIVLMGLAELQYKIVSPVFGKLMPQLTGEQVPEPARKKEATYE